MWLLDGLVALVPFVPATPGLGLFVLGRFWPN